MDEYIERGGDAHLPEDVLTAILLQKLPSTYDVAKNGLLNSITLGFTKHYISYDEIKASVEYDFTDVQEDCDDL